MCVLPTLFYYFQHKNSQTMKKILFFASLLFVASCSQKSAVPVPIPTVPTPIVPVVIDSEKEILDEIKQLP